MKLWDKGISMDKTIEAFTVGNDRTIDLHIASYDLCASLAHAKMLAQVEILDKDELKQVEHAIAELQKEVDKGAFKIEDDFEDVHSKIEFELTQRIGEAGKKIHTARSRNDQVLVALQLYYKDNLNTVQEQIKVLFDTLMTLAENDQPKLFHCTAGKDRAGFAAALILLTLGVPKETVLEDYMKTNAANAEYVNSYLGKVKAMSLFQADVEKLRPVMGVQERYILKAFETIEKNYGSVEVYLTEGLNISSDTIEKLKELYLDA